MKSPKVLFHYYFTFFFCILDLVGFVASDDFQVDYFSDVSLPDCFEFLYLDITDLYRVLLSNSF